MIIKLPILPLVDLTISFGVSWSVFHKIETRPKSFGVKSPTPCPLPFSLLTVGTSCCIFLAFTSCSSKLSFNVLFHYWARIWLFLMSRWMWCFLSTRLTLCVQLPHPLCQKFFQGKACSYHPQVLTFPLAVVMANFFSFCQLLSS